MSGMYEINYIAAESIGADPETTDVIATAFGLVHVLQVYTSAMLAVAVWDWLACLKVEYDVIWKSRWSLVKFLYLWTRYYGLVTFALNLWLFNGNFTPQRCRPLHYLIAATCMWVTLSSEAILAMRTWAFFGQKLWTGILLSIMLLGETAFLLYVSIAGVHQTVLPVVTKGPCTASDAPGKHIVSGFWLAPVAFDLFCTLLMLWKVMSFKMRELSRLMKVFVGEGIFYFILVAAVNVLNAIFMFQSNANIQNINCFLALILAQVLCCRLVLNLRVQARRASVLYSTRDGGDMPAFAGNSATHPTLTTCPHISAGSASSGGTVTIPLDSFHKSSCGTVEMACDPFRKSHLARSTHGGDVKVHVQVDDVESARGP